MKTRRIGRTALEVTEISFGAAALGGLYRACPRKQAMETLEAAWNHGIRYFDVAPWYGLGLGERRVGDLELARCRGGRVLVLAHCQPPGGSRDGAEDQRPHQPSQGVTEKQPQQCGNDYHHYRASLHLPSPLLLEHTGCRRKQRKGATIQCLFPTV